MKKFHNSVIYNLSVLILIPAAVFGTQFTFELADSTESCFNEVIPADTSVTIEYQVVSGGNLDINVVVEGPNNEPIYRREHEEYDTIEFKTNHTGEYIVCFSNQFSTFTHKVVFISFITGDEKPLVPSTDHLSGPLTFLESASGEIHKSLNLVLDSQTHFRLREAQGRRFAEELSALVVFDADVHHFSHKHIAGADSTKLLQ